MRRIEETINNDTLSLKTPYLVQDGMAIPIQETIYYKRVAKKIPTLDQTVLFSIHVSDIEFWKEMITSRVTCASDWITHSDNYELHESDLSIFTDILVDLNSSLALSLHRKKCNLKVSVYKMHALIEALEIQSHVAMCEGDRKTHVQANKYGKLLREASKLYRLTFEKIDEIILGRQKAIMY